MWPYKKYFINFYKGSDTSLEKINEFLKKQNLLRTTEEQRQIMNGLITIREVSEAIKKV